eukprot:6180802-Pleurochrysis_carterae.AAC.1
MKVRGIKTTRREETEDGAAASNKGGKCRETACERIRGESRKLERRKEGKTSKGRMKAELMKQGEGSRE